MNFEGYTEIKPFRKHYLLLDDALNSLVLLKEYTISQKLLLVKLQRISNNCNVPNILEIKQRDNKILTIEEFISGVTLEEYLKNIKNDDLVISIEFLQNFLKCMYEILRNFKDQNLIHKDIKTSNIIVVDEKTFYLIDFDISRVYDEKKDKDTTLFGTHGYAAPEQYGFSQTTYKSDVYSLGKVLEDVYNLMKKDSAIEEMIKNMTSIDIKDRASLKEVGNFIKNDDMKHELVSLIPFYYPFNKNILNVIYNLCVIYFIVNLDISFLSEIQVDNKIIILLVNIMVLILVKLFHVEFVNTKFYKKIIGYTQPLKVILISLYGIALLFLVYVILILIFDILNLVLK